jgi:hypothetical protein
MSALHVRRMRTSPPDEYLDGWYAPDAHYEKGLMFWL